MNFLFLISRQGKMRLGKWYTPLSAKEKAQTVREVSQTILGRSPKFCHIIDNFKGQTLVCRRYASLYFCCGIDRGTGPAAVRVSSTVGGGKRVLLSPNDAGMRGAASSASSLEPSIRNASR